MTQYQLGKAFGISQISCGAMNTDDFRDYMLSFLFLRYLSNNYEEAAPRTGKDYPTLDAGISNLFVCLV